MIKRWVVGGPFVPAGVWWESLEAMGFELVFRPGDDNFPENGLQRELQARVRHPEWAGGAWLHILFGLDYATPARHVPDVVAGLLQARAEWMAAEVPSIAAHYVGYAGWVRGGVLGAREALSGYGFTSGPVWDDWQARTDDSSLRQAIGFWHPWNSYCAAFVDLLMHVMVYAGAEESDIDGTRVTPRPLSYSLPGQILAEKLALEFDGEPIYSQAPPYFTAFTEDDPGEED